MQLWHGQTAVLGADLAGGGGWWLAALVMFPALLSPPFWFRAGRGLVVVRVGVCRHDLGAGRLADNWSRLALQPVNRYLISRACRVHFIHILLILLELFPLKAEQVTGGPSSA